MKSLDNLGRVWHRVISGLEITLPEKLQGEIDPTPY